MGQRGQRGQRGQMGGMVRSEGEVGGMRANRPAVMAR